MWLYHVQQTNNNTLSKTLLISDNATPHPNRKLPLLLITLPLSSPKIPISTLPNGHRPTLPPPPPPTHSPPRSPRRLGAGRRIRLPDLRRRAGPVGNGNVVLRRRRRYYGGGWSDRRRRSESAVAVLEESDPLLHFVRRVVGEQDPVPAALRQVLLYAQLLQSERSGSSLHSRLLRHHPLPPLILNRNVS